MHSTPVAKLPLAAQVVQSGRRYEHAWQVPAYGSKNSCLKGSHTHTPDTNEKVGWQEVEAEALRQVMELVGQVMQERESGAM